ncbi:MAG TPA: CPBP family intramembrane glutamic endopeptidase [Symbiobacteriaceae bacterium]|nr:CPBP family intramembrane glutamic endopeptidase [Symbiobacteriaceae bacterium]
MLAFAAALQTAIAAWLVLGQPFLGRYKYELLKFRLPTDPRARYRSYAASAITEWGLFLAVLLSLRLGKLPLTAIGLKPPAGPVTWYIVAAAFVGAIALIVQMYRSPEMREAYREGSGHIRQLLPVTAGERAGFAAIAVTAGICEETLFRGFLTFYLVTLLPWLPLWAAAVLASLSFGLGHWYQGRRGILQTGALGLLLAGFYLATGSLYGPMAVHAIIDLLALGLSWAATRTN